LNRTFQAAQIKQSFEFRRWSLNLVDDLTYTAQSVFGYSGLSSLGASNFTPGTTPNQTILSSPSRQISNTAGCQVNYELNSRSSITFAGDLGLLRFPDGTLLESDQGGFQVGYNHNLNPRDALGISYGFTSIWYPDPSIAPRADSHKIQMVYGRKITGRLALRLSGGPQIYHFNDPILGAVSHPTWMAQGSLAYRFRRAQVELGYRHSLNGGAGVLALVRTDQVEGGFTSQLTRTVSAYVRAGYAHNMNLQELATVANLAFDTQFVEAGLKRPLGHNANVVLNYSFQHQSANLSTCELGLCGGDLQRHVAELGFEWHLRPILIR